MEEWQSNSKDRSGIEGASGHAPRIEMIEVARLTPYAGNARTRVYPLSSPPNKES